MQPSHTPRYTIGQLMVAIAALAIVLAIPPLLNSPDRVVVISSAGMLVVLALLNAMIEVLFGKTCPACSRRTLRRLARHHRYYRCLACRAQLKRFGFGPWLDASGPEDAGRYRKRSEAGVWREYTVPDKLDGSSSGQLLQSKRSGDLIGEVHPPPRGPDERRRLEQAERKVRKFLKRWRDGEE